MECKDTRIDSIIRDSIFNGTLAYATNMSHDLEKLDILVIIVKSYFDSIGLKDLVFNKVISSSTSDELEDRGNAIELYFTDSDNTIAYSVFITKGLFIQYIKTVVDINLENLGNITAPCINHKTYMINKEITFNIDFDVK